MTLSVTADPALVDERDLTELVADWRRGRATLSVWQAISNAYIAIFTVVMCGAMIGNVIVQTQVSLAQCTTTSCVAARGVLPWAAVAISISVAIAISRLFGPVVASPAEGFWLLDAPIRRGHLLAGRLFGVVGATLLIAAGVGALVAALTGSPAALILAWAAATGCAASGAVALAAAQQNRDSSRAIAVLGGLFSIVSLAALLTVVVVSAGQITLPASIFGVQNPSSNPAAVVLAGPGRIALGVAAVGLLTTCVAVVMARRRLDQLQRTRLTSGGSLVSGLSGAMFALDLGLMNDIVVARRCQEIGHVRSRSAGGIGTGAVVRRDAWRLLRFPRPLLGVAVVACVPYVVNALGLGVLTPVISSLALFGALVPMMGGLRVFSRSGGMARSLPFSTGQLKRASVVVPAVTALVWALITAPAYLNNGGLNSGEAAALTLPEAMIRSYLIAAAGLLGAIRWTVAKPINFSAPMMATQAGALPPGMIGNLIRGFDICLLISAPLVLGLPWIVSLALASICALILLGSFDLDEMQYRAKTQRAELDRLKTARTR